MQAHADLPIQASRWALSTALDSPLMDAAAWTLTLFFCLLVLAHFITHTWLLARQARHVQAHASQVPPPFEQRIDLASHQKAARYTVAKVRLGFLSLFLETVVLLGWTLLGGLDALNHILLDLMGVGLWQQVALLTFFALIGGLLSLPLAWWMTFRVESRFGFNRMGFGLWIADLLKGTLLAALIGVPLATLVLWLMGAAGPLWWLGAWGAWTVFNLLLMVLFPTVIAPWFNRFEPLQDEALKQRVEALMQRCGFSSKGLYVMDGSRRSAHANAYFTGLGSAKRVVFFDTLLQQLNPDEVDAVLAHELGHHHHRHLRRRMVFMLCSSLLGFALLGWVSSQAWFYAGLGVTPSMDAPNDALALVLFMLTVPLAGFFASPALTARSRRDEFEADAYAIQQTSGKALATALLKLYRDNASTLTPDPWYVRFHHSHPPAVERLARLLP